MYHSVKIQITRDRGVGVYDNMTRTTKFPEMAITFTSISVKMFIRAMMIVLISENLKANLTLLSVR